MSTSTPTRDKHNDKRVVLYSLIIALAACSFGFDQSETGGFLAMTKFNEDFGTYDPALRTRVVTAGHQTLMYGVECGFILFGSLSSGWISQFYGRKVGLYLCAIATIIGACIQMVPHYSALVIGRAFMGLAIGFAAVFSIAYWSEIATPTLRGSVVIFYQLFLNLAGFVGSCIDEGTHSFSSRWAYRAPLMTMLIPPLLIIALVWLIPESPRWLVLKERDDQAAVNLAKIRGPTYTEGEVQRELDEILKFTALENALDDSSSYLECFKGTDLRRTLLTMMTTGGQQLMGVAFMAGYLTYFFALVGFTNAFIITVISQGVAVAGTVAAFPIVKYIGRRPVMIVGSFVTGFCMLAFASIAEAAPGSPAAAKSIVAFITIFSFAYSASWGSVGPSIIGEIPSNRLRSKTISLALGLSWIIALLVICGVPYLINVSYADLGTKVGFIFGGLTVLVFIGTILFLPETKDRTLEEIDEMFMNRVATRHFRTYVCTQQVAGYDLSQNSEKLGIAQIEVHEAK